MITITYYNDRNDVPLSNYNIQEATNKVIEKESDAHNVTVNNFSHTSNTQRENTNTIFTSEKLDKLENLEETLKELTINDAEYYVSNSVNANDTKGEPAGNPKTFTHTIDVEGKVTDTSNGILQHKLLSKRTLPVVVLTMNPSIENRIAIIGGDYRTLPTPATKEVVADAARGSVRVNQTLRHVRRMARDGITPGKTGLAVSSKPASYPFLIGSTTISPACGLSEILQVGKKRQYNSPDRVRNAKKLDTAVGKNFPNDWYSASVFSKAIFCNLSHGSSNYLYLSCRMKFSINVVQTEVPQFVDLGLPAVNTLNELGILGTHANRIRSPTDESHWLDPDNVFGGASAVGMSAARSDQD